MALQETAADAEPLSQQRSSLAPLAEPQGDLWGLDTEARRKRARHSRSGGTVPRTLAFEAAASDTAASPHRAEAHAPDASEAERGRRDEGRSRVDMEKGEDEAEAEVGSSGSSDSDENRASAGGAATAAAKALARVMRLQSERSRLQHAIQVGPQAVVCSLSHFFLSAVCLFALIQLTEKSLSWLCLDSGKHCANDATNFRTSSSRSMGTQAIFLEILERFAFYEQELLYVTLLE